MTLTIPASIKEPILRRMGYEKRSVRVYKMERVYQNRFSTDTWEEEGWFKKDDTVEEMEYIRFKDNHALDGAFAKIWDNELQQQVLGRLFGLTGEKLW